MLIGFDPETEFSILSWLSQKLVRNLEQDDVIVGHYIISPLGSPLQFYGHEFNVGGKLEPTGIGLDKTVFIQIEDARKMIRESGDKAIQKLEIEPNQISSILIRVDRTISTVPEVALKIQASVPGVSVILSNKLIEGTNIQISSATSSLLLLTPAILAISTMTVFTFFSMIINERQREIGLLRAIGASRLHIFQLILIEAILLTAIGSIVGVIVGGSLIYGFISYFMDMLKVPYLWPSGSYIVLLAITSLSIGVLTGILGAFYPSIRSSIKDPLSAIRRE
jgi:putative ABC transport system permease protein